jgi:hypothetical protein
MIPMVQRYQQQGLAFDDAVNVFEYYISQNPFLAVFEADEHDFKTPEAYDNFLVGSFGAACEATNFDMGLAVQAVFGDNTGYYQPTTEIVDTVKNLGNKIYNYNATGGSVGHLRAAKHKIIDKNLNPIWQGLKNQMDALIGEKAEKEEVIKGSKLLQIRRLFLKLLVVYKSKFIVNSLAAALLPGGFLMWIIKSLIFLAGMVGFAGYSIVTAKRAVFSDPDRENAQKRCLYELELELKMVREKINDARSHGKEKEKYQLMRVEAAIEKEIYRIRYGQEPDRNLGTGNNG